MTENLLLSNNPDAFRKKNLDNLAFLREYVANDFGLRYDNKDYQRMRDTLYYRNVCDLIKGVRAGSPSLWMK